MSLQGLGKVSEPDAPTLRRYLEQFRYVAPLDGLLLRGTIPAGQTYVLITHSLGRAYAGGFIAGVSAAEPVYVQVPDQAAIGGTDIKKQCVVFSKAAVAADTQVSVWLF